MMTMMTKTSRRRFAALLLVVAAGLPSGCALVADLGSDHAPDTVPDLAEARFGDPARIDNPFFPLAPGTTRVFRSDTEAGPEEIVVEVLADTRVVAGVVCRVVRDRVYLNGVLIEDTLDWYAQDDAGNVWYMGEDVSNYNYGSDGQLIDITTEGAWEAQQDVLGAGRIALPGLIMPADPRPGMLYHQEYYLGEAEDMAEIVGVDVPVTLADGASYTCLQTRDFTPLEPGVNTFKYYAPGVGVVLEVAVESGERVELAATP